MKQLDRPEVQRGLEREAMASPVPDERSKGLGGMLERAVQALAGSGKPESRKRSRSERAAQSPPINTIPLRDGVPLTNGNLEGKSTSARRQPNVPSPPPTPTNFPPQTFSRTKSFAREPTPPPPDPAKPRQRKHLGVRARDAIPDKQVAPKSEGSGNGLVRTILDMAEQGSDFARMLSRQLDFGAT